MDLSARALHRSQQGPRAGRARTALPTSAETTLSPRRTNVMLRRRLRRPLPLGPRRCDGRTCRQQLDPCGHHWTACRKSGRLGRRAKPIENTWARVLREAGATVGLLEQQRLATWLAGCRLAEE